MRKNCVARSILDKVLGQADLTTTTKSPKAHRLMLIGCITEECLIACWDLLSEVGYVGWVRYLYRKCNQDGFEVEVQLLAWVERGFREFTTDITSIPRAEGR